MRSSIARRAGLTRYGEIDARFRRRRFVEFPDAFQFNANIDHLTLHLRTWIFGPRDEEHAVDNASQPPAFFQTRAERLLIFIERTRFTGATSDSMRMLFTGVRSSCRDVSRESLQAIKRLL